MVTSRKLTGRRSKGQECFAAGFRAKTSAAQGKEKESEEKKADFGEVLSGAFAIFDQIMFSWRTCQPCLFGGWELFSETWPEAGMMRNGVCYRQPVWERIIKGEGCSYMPTPTAGTPPKNGLRWDEVGGSQARSMLLKHMSLAETKQHRNPEYIEWQLGFPINWTDCDALETLLTRTSQKS